MPKRLRNRRNVAIRKSLALFRALLFSLIVFGALAANAQDTGEQFWPEVNVYVHINEKIRLFLLGTVSKTIEDGELRNSQAFDSQVGAHIDYIPNKHVILRTGYRFGSSVGDTTDPYKEHRIVTEQTLRKLLPGDILLSDRNREDFRFISGEFSFRYRNRVTLEREFHVFKQRSVTPYVSGEVYYDTRFDTWNRNRWAVGVQTSLRRNALIKMLLPKRQIVLDLYYMRQNDSRSSDPHVNALGAVLAFYF
jgi:hypothetical protein